MTAEAKSGFQPYKPDDSRLQMPTQLVAPSHPYGLDPSAVAAYAPYHHAAAVMAASANFYPPPQMQTPYR